MLFLEKHVKSTKKTLQQCFAAVNLQVTCQNGQKSEQKKKKWRKIGHLRQVCPQPFNYYKVNLRE